MRGIVDPIWEKILSNLSKTIQPKYYEPFISPLSFIKLEDEVLYIHAPNIGIKTHVESKYQHYLQQAVYDAVGDRCRVEILTSIGFDKHISSHIQDQFQQPDESLLNPDYTFDQFLLGESNQLAFTAAQSVAENPGKINPLYLFGKVGVGKTHLMHSIAHEIKKRHPWMTVRYVDMTSFMNEFVFTVRQNNRTALDSFKLKYQSYNVLLIDDIQFLNSGADKTQEEFFALFNFLYERKRQIVIASDRPSHELPIHDRLKSRFITGVQVDIRAPEADLRSKIIQRYSEMYSLGLSPESIDFVVQSIPSDVRGLIGAINDLSLYKKAFGLLALPLDKVKNCLEPRIQRKPILSDISHDRVIESIALYFQKDIKDLLGKSRKSELIFPRHLAMYILSEHFQISKSQIGRIFSAQHTSVIHAVDSIRQKIGKKPEIQNYIQELLAEVGMV